MAQKVHGWVLGVGTIGCPWRVRNLALALKDSAPKYNNDHPLTRVDTLPVNSTQTYMDFLPQGHYAIKALSGFPLS